MINRLLAHPLGLAALLLVLEFAINAAASLVAHLLRWTSEPPWFFGLVLAQVIVANGYAIRLQRRMPVATAALTAAAYVLLACGLVAVVIVTRHPGQDYRTLKLAPAIGVLLGLGLWGLAAAAARRIERSRDAG